MIYRVWSVAVNELNLMQKKSTKTPQLIKPTPSINWVFLRNSLIITLVILLVVTSIQIQTIKPLIKEKIAQTKESARPGNIELVLIKPDCAECFNIQPLVDAIKKMSVNVTSEKKLMANASEAQQFISRYNITQLPTLLVFGEYNKSQLPGIASKQGYGLTEQIPAPYYDLQKKRVVGLVEVTLITEPSCRKCTDLALVLDQVKTQFGIKTATVREFTSAMPKAQELIKAYNLSYLPAMLFSSDLEAYPELASRWSLAGSIEKDGMYVFRKVNPPLYDVKHQNVVGLVTLTYVNDTACKECYDVTVHKTILQNFGVAIGQEKTVDINSAQGKSLKEKFKLEKVPTIILDEQASVYPVLLQVWQQVGEERSGSFVFTKVDQLGMPYKDLVTNKVITPQPPENEG